MLLEGLIAPFRLLFHLPVLKVRRLLRRELKDRGFVMLDRSRIGNRVRGTIEIEREGPVGFEVNLDDDAVTLFDHR